MMKLYYILFVTISVLLVSCSDNEEPKKEIKQEQSAKIEIKKDSVSFNIDFYPEKSIIVDSNLVLLGKDETGNYRMFAVNIKSGKANDEFLKTFYDREIAKLTVKNDTVIGFFESERTWGYWNNKWNKYQLTNDWVFNGKYGVLNYLLEDNTYIVYSLDYGEFGGEVYFYNKKTDRLYGMKLYGPVLCVKDKDGYIVNGSLPHNTGFVEILKIKKPETLIEIPDSFNIIKYSELKSSFVFIEKQENEFLPDSLEEKIRNPQKFDVNAYQMSKQIIKNKLRVETILDTTDMLCYATIPVKGKYLHIFQKRKKVNAGIVEGAGMNVIDSLYDESLFSYDFSSRLYKNVYLISFSYWQQKIRKEKMICLVWRDEKLTRYNFN